MRTKLLVVSLSVFFFILVIELIRREKLTFKYAVLWFMLSLFGITFACFEDFLFKIARSLGFVLPSNFIFFLIGVIFVLFSLILTVYLCQQNSRLEAMAQKIGIIEMELKKSKDGK